MDFQEAPIAVSAIDGGMRVALLGAIHTNNTWLESELTKLLKHKPKRVELDLSKTEYVSSSGIGTLVWLRNELLAAGGTLNVTSVHPQVFASFKFAGLAQIFGMSPAIVHRPPA